MVSSTAYNSKIVKFLFATLQLTKITNHNTNQWVVMVYSEHTIIVLKNIFDKLAISSDYLIMCWQPHSS